MTLRSCNNCKNGRRLLLDGPSTVACFTCNGSGRVLTPNEGAIVFDCTTVVVGRAVLVSKRPVARYSAYVWKMASMSEGSFLPFVYSMDMVGNPWLADLQALAARLRGETLGEMARATEHGRYMAPA